MTSRRNPSAPLALALAALAIAASPAAIAQAPAAAATPRAVSAREFFPMAPGLAWRYRVSVEGGKDGIAGTHWIAFQDPPPDSILSYVYASEGRAVGVGRYFPQAGGFLFRPMRNISGGSEHRGLLDLLNLPESIVDGAEYTGFRNIAYKATVEPGLARVRIEFDSTASDYAELQGTGAYWLARGVGIESLSFVHARPGLYGPAGARVSWVLVSNDRAGARTVSGRLVGPDGKPLAGGAVALCTSWLNPPDAYKPVARADASGRFSIRVYCEEGTPLLLTYGVDANGDWGFDGDTKSYRIGADRPWTSAGCEVGDLPF